jgi:hypothetical protein
VSKGECEEGRGSVEKEGRAHAKATGRLVKNPKAIVAMPEIAAVAVIKSLLIPVAINKVS